MSNEPLLAFDLRKLLFQTFGDLLLPTCSKGAASHCLERVFTCYFILVAVLKFKYFVARNGNSISAGLSSYNVDVHCVSSLMSPLLLLQNYHNTFLACGLHQELTITLFRVF